MWWWYGDSNFAGVCVIGHRWWPIKLNLFVSGRDGGGRAEPDGRGVWWGGRATNFQTGELAVRPRRPRPPRPTPRRPLHGSDGDDPPWRAKLLDHPWGEGRGTPAPSQLVTSGRNGTETEPAIVMHDGTAAHRWCCTETWTAIQEQLCVSVRCRAALWTSQSPWSPSWSPSSTCWSPPPLWPMGSNASDMIHSTLKQESPSGKACGLDWPGRSVGEPN